MLEAFAIFVPFLLAGFLLPWWQNICKKIFVTPTGKRGPVGGGWLLAALVAALLFGVTFTPAEHFPPHLTPDIMAQFSLVSLLAIVLASLYQKTDRTGIAPKKWRATLPFIGVGIGSFFMPDLLPSLSYYPERALYMVIWLLIIRAFVLADKLDGLAAITTAIICVGLSILVKPVAVPALILAGSCLGFLRFNRPDALLLLGLSGRMWLGFIVGGLWLMAAGATPHTPEIFALLILLVPILFNNFITQNPWHMRLEALGLTPGKTLGRLISLQIGCLVLAVLAFASPIPLWFLIMSIILMLLHMVHIKWLERSF